MTTATVRVGYEYRDCGNSLDGLVWHIETTRMSGHDLASTDIGGWNLHVQHKYNFHSGILQKGDGNTIYLKYKPQVRLCIYILIMLETMMGFFCQKDSKYIRLRRKGEFHRPQQILMKIIMLKVHTSVTNIYSNREAI